jgi:putative ABC transport system permease protein
LADRLRGVYGVGAVSTMRYASTTINNQDMNVLGIDPEDFPQVAGLNFQAGDSQSAFAQLGLGRAVILNALGSAQGRAGVGDNIRLKSPEGEQTYQVVGVANDYLNTKIPTAYISQANLKRDFHKTEDVFLQVKLARGADRAQVESRFEEIVARYPQFKLVSGQAYLDEIFRISQASFSLIYILLAVLALPSLIAILNTLAIGVIERTREIGMLRAIGATQRQVRRTILAEALLLAATGTALGLVAGLYLGYVMVVGVGASGLFPLAYSFPLAGILAAIAVGLIFGVIAALLPARQASRMNIIHALRYE